MLKSLELSACNAYQYYIVSSFTLFFKTAINILFATQLQYSPTTQYQQYQTKIPNNNTKGASNQLTPTQSNINSNQSHKPKQPTIRSNRNQLATQSLKAKIQLNNKDKASFKILKGKYRVNSLTKPNEATPLYM